MKTTKRALFSSVIALILCFSMLVGTTFAWFTDSVESGINTIVAGNLDVELYHTNKYITAKEKVDGLTDLFTVEEGKTFLWEPGAVVWENFEVANEGTLALKYQLALNFTNAIETASGSGKTLADVLKVAVIAGGFTGTREEAQQLAYNYSLKTFALEGELAAGAASDVYGIVIYWEPSANDNDYNVKTALSIDLGIKLFATQLEAETDSFGDDYDVEAGPMPELPAGSSTTAAVKDDGSATMTSNETPSADTNQTTVDAPAGTFDPTDKVEMAVSTTNSLFDVNADGAVVASLDVTLTVNGQPAADLTGGNVYTVTTYISKGLSNVVVTYEGTAHPTEYDPATGKLVFTTNHFSVYEVSGAALAYDTKNDTALTTIEQVIESTQTEGSAVVIPEENKTAIEEEIQKLPEEEQEAAAAATAAAKIGETTYATLSEALAALKDGDTLVLLNNAVVNADTATTITGKVVINLNGKTMAGVSTKTGANRSLIVVTKGGDLTVEDGTVTMEHKGANMGWNNSTNALEAVSGGKLTLENVYVKNLGGSDMAYAVNIANNGGATLKTIKSTIESVNYVALRIFNNADGEINVDLTEGTKLIGNSSPFFVHFWSEADLGTKQEARQAFLKVNFNDTQVSRYSGSKSLLRFGFTDAIYYSGTDMTEVVAGNADALIWALENGKNVLLNNDIKIDPANMSNAYGTTGINVKEGQTLDGNGYTLDVQGAGGTWDSGICTNGGCVVKNITVSGAFRGIFIRGGTEKVVLENVTTKGTVYTISCDQAEYQGLEATNCTFNGWSSFAGTIGSAKFVNCNFGYGSGYKFCRPYAPTEFVNCNFTAEGYTLDPCAAVTLNGCTLNGKALTAENITSLVSGSKMDKVTLNGANYKYVANTEELQAAINAGEANILLGKGEFTADLYTVPANRNLTITGQGADTTLSFKKLQVRLALFDTLKISNCTMGRMLDKSWGQLVFGSSEKAGGVYTLSNCIFNGQGTQGIFINQNVAATFNIENCTFNGDFGGEGAITIQDNDVAGLVVDVKGCTFNNIPETSHEIAVLFTSTNEWTLNANGANVWYRDK